jgi:invasion protein IalB
MIWSRDRWNTLSRRAARLMLCGGAGLLAMTLAAPLATAQQAPAGQAPAGQAPAGQAQPKSTPVPKAPVAGAPAGAPAGAAGATPMAGAATEDAWVKLCMKSEQTQNKEICLINHEGLEPNTGMVLIAAAVRKVEGEEKQQLLVRVPTAYALVIPAGVELKIDDQQPIKLQYAICFPTSCQVQLELTKELMENMRKGKQMIVAAMNIQQKTMGFPVPLSGFAKAYDGPPVDSAKYEESRRQLMEVFRKRQQELAAKAAQAEQNKQAGQPGAQAPAGGQAPAANATAQQKQPPAAPQTP